MGKILEIKNLYKQFDVDGKKIEVLKNINLDIEEGEFITIVGHSGCGKSTLLKIIAGLECQSSGTLLRNGKNVDAPSPEAGMVFQEHRLLPWLKIKDNIGFGLGGLAKEEREKLVSKYIHLVHLDGFENAYPSQLSGGMSQRAAIARGLSTNPSILLLDEPFGALDALTRIEMQQELLRIWQEQKTTMIMVTHDIDEAIYLGRRVVVMSARPGEIKEVIDIHVGDRTRGSADFGFYKKRIFEHFFTEPQIQEVEYSI